MSQTKQVLESERVAVIDWVGYNKVQVNPDKLLGLKRYENCKSRNTCGTEITCNDSVKLIGVTFDYMLNFQSSWDDIMITKFVWRMYFLKLTRKRSKSIVFFSRVGKCTNCSKPWSFITPINICSSDWLNIDPWLVMSVWPRSVLEVEIP